MQAGTRNGSAGPTMPAVALGVTLFRLSNTHHVGRAILCGLLTLPALVGLYSLLAAVMGRPPLEWSDVAAL